MKTRGEEMLALRRARMAASPPFLRGGFRPFFFGGTAWAVIALLLWICSLSGALSLPTAVDALHWHRHEMLFGFVGAIIAGFLMTAIPNWTGRLPIAGVPLASLFGLWLLARAAMLFSADTGTMLAALLDVGFYLVLAAVGFREVLQAKNRNVPIVFIILLLAAASALDHAAMLGADIDPDLGIHAGISLVVVLIALIGGRIIPSFTRNWLAKRGRTKDLPTQPNRFDLASIAVTAVALLAWTALPAHRLSGVLLLGAGLFQLLRMVRWQGLKTVADPLVFVLHVGFFWVPVGLLLLGASILLPEVPRTASIHALTAGAMATMILAVMTRASLGHTGRALHASGAVTVSYVMITAGALTRVAAPFLPEIMMPLLHASALLWGGAFVIFLIAYAPVLFRHRVGDPTQ